MPFLYFMLPKRCVFLPLSIMPSLLSLSILTTLSLLQMWPYTTNPIRDTLGRTRNWDDSLNIFNDSHGPEGDYNPVFKAEKLGAILDQGLIAYITMVRGFEALFFHTDGRRNLSLDFRASIRVLHMIISGRGEPSMNLT